MIGKLVDEQVYASVYAQRGNVYSNLLEKKSNFLDFIAERIEKTSDNEFLLLPAHTDISFVLASVNANKISGNPSEICSWLLNRIKKISRNEVIGFQRKGAVYELILAVKGSPKVYTLINGSDLASMLEIIMKDVERGN